MILNKKYFGQRHHTNWGKNKLLEAVKSYLKDWDRSIIPEQEIEQAKAEITSKIHELCGEFKRCQPVKFYWSVDKYENRPNLNDHKLFIDGYHLPDYVFRGGEELKS